SRAGTDHVKIVDFGIARVMSKESQQLTSTGIAVGTPEYMSPEQFAGDTLDARTDIYSLALVAYHVLTGTHAFGTGTTTDHLLARLTQPPRRLSAVKADVDWPESMQRVFDKALAADPSQRYSDVLDFARDFTEAVAELPVTTTEEHYLSAIATRRLTPPRTFTPARGVPTVETATTGAGGSTDAADGTTAGAWEDSSPAVAVTTPSGERPTQEITPVTREGVTATTTTGHDTPPPHPPASVDDAADAESEEPTVTIAAIEGERPKPGRRAGLLVGAGLLVATAAVAAAVALRPGDTTTAQVAPPIAPPKADSPAATAPPPAESLATVAPPPVSTLALDSAVTRMRGGVIGVISSEGRGTGFLADTLRGAGLVVTSTSFVPRDSIVDVQVDGSIRLRGRVAAADRSAGIAVVAVALQPWSAYRILPIAADTSFKGGDSLAALGSAFVGPSVKRGVARETDQGAARPGLSVVRADAGRPVVSATSAVVAVATVRGNQSTFAPASAVDAALRAARGRIAREDFRAPSASVLPAWPAPAYPADAVREASRRDSIDSAPYRAAGQGFRVFAMTPPVLAWRDSAIARTRAYWDSPFQLNKYPYERVDPIQAWSSFRTTVAERRPVIVLSVVPEGVPELRYRRFPDVSDQRSDRVDVRSARLVRNGETILPLDSARFAAVVNPKDYRDRRRPVRDERLLVFRLDALAQTGAYSVEIVPSEGRTVNLVLPQALLDAVRHDAGRWRPSR
ncbi:MAG: putative serine/threonine protein kinase, partial [Geminicoccaceae bacterium]|nr:putative serine/threonine protein kinase [Geminicoccaceae bacterium]